MYGSLFLLMISDRPSVGELVNLLVVSSCSAESILGLLEEDITEDAKIYKINLFSYLHIEYNS